jgi:hypothetical protein
MKDRRVFVVGRIKRSTRLAAEHRHQFGRDCSFPRREHEFRGTRRTGPGMPAVYTGVAEVRNSDGRFRKVILSGSYG